MEQTGNVPAPPPLLSLGEDDAAVCADGFCQVPAPAGNEAPHAD